VGACASIEEQIPRREIKNNIFFIFIMITGYFLFNDFFDKSQIFLRFLYKSLGY